MTDATGPTPRRSWLKLALIVSLAINLLVIGLVASFFWKHSQGGPRGGKYERMATVIEEFIPELPEASREATKARLAQSREEVTLLTEKIQDLRKQIREQVTAETFDEAKLRETLELLRSARAEQGRSMSEAAFMVVRELSQEQRKKFLEAMRSRMHGRRYGSGKDK